MGMLHRQSVFLKSVSWVGRAGWNPLWFKIESLPCSKPKFYRLPVRWSNGKAI